MIKTIVSGSAHVTVSGGLSSAPYISPGAISAGQMRFNPNFQIYEVYDGLTWHNVSSQVQIDLSAQAKEILAWADNKMKEEAKLKELMGRNPGLKDLYEKFEMMRALCYEEEKHK